MRRRTLIRRSGALAAIGLAGCVSSPETDDGGANENGTDDPTMNGNGDTDGDGGDGGSTTAVTTTNIETLSADCADSQDDSARREIADGTVTVTGAIIAGNPCHEAKLDDVTVASGSSEDGGTALEVAVVTESTDEMCIECVGAIEYEATIEFDGEAPADVRVLHDGEAVASSDEDHAGSGSGSEAKPSAITGRTLTVTEQTGGGQVDEVQIDFDTDGNAVSLTGTIWGSNGCQTASLGEATYDADEDQLDVSIVTESTNPDGICTQEIVEISYEATISFDDGVPTSASVSHDGRGVASAAHGSTSAGDGS